MNLSPMDKVKLEQLETALAMSPLRLPVSPLIQNLTQEVATFRAENRDGRGVTQAAGKRTGRLLDRLPHAVRHAVEHPDGNLRVAAATLVRSAQYETFEQLDARAKAFVGSLRRSGHRRNERQQREQAWSANLNDGCVLAEVATPDALREVGRKSQLCVANRGIACDYLADSRCFTLSHEGEFVCLLNVDQTDKVSEIGAPAITRSTCRASSRWKSSMCWAQPPTGYLRLREWVRSARTYSGASGMSENAWSSTGASTAWTSSLADSRWSFGNAAPRASGSVGLCSS